jgi:hypothetical protein
MVRSRSRSRYSAYYLFQEKLTIHTRDRRVIERRHVSQRGIAKLILEVI